jgi:glycolate oxidase
VGLAKKAYLKQQLGDASYRLLEAVKRTLDPEGVLNPGKIFDLAEHPTSNSQHPTSNG